MLNEQDFVRLLEQAKAGDSDSLGVLCEEARVRLGLVVKYRLRGWSEADREDLVQDTLVTFCEKIQDITGTPMNFALWILRQKIGNELQKARRFREQSFSSTVINRGNDGGDLALDPPDPEVDVAATVERKESVERIMEVMLHLSDFCRLVFAGLLEGFRIQEIWEKYQLVEPGLKRSAFDKRTHDCRRRMAELMGAIE
jgi:DNA-directed RNA polymerase specialized sigma24 family protein